MFNLFLFQIGQRVNNNNFKMEDVNPTPAFSDIDSSVSTPQSMNPQIQTADDQQHHQTNQQPAPPGNLFSLFQTSQRKSEHGPERLKIITHAMFNGCKGGFIAVIIDKLA